MAKRPRGDAHQRQRRAQARNAFKKFVAPINPRDSTRDQAGPDGPATRPRGQFLQISTFLKPQGLVLIVSSFILLISLVTIARSTPPNPGSIVALGANPSASFVPVNVDSTNNLIVTPNSSVMWPASGTGPFIANTCTAVPGGTSQMVEQIVHASAQNESSSLYFLVFDDTAPGCNASNIVIPAQQFGATQMLPMMDWKPSVGIAVCWSTSETTCTGSTAPHAGVRIFRKLQ